MELRSVNRRRRCRGRRFAEANDRADDDASRHNAADDEWVEGDGSSRHWTRGRTRRGSLRRRRRGFGRRGRRGRAARCGASGGRPSRAACTATLLGHQNRLAAIGRRGLRTQRYRTCGEKCGCSRNGNPFFGHEEPPIWHTPTKSVTQPIRNIGHVARGNAATFLGFHPVSNAWALCRPKKMSPPRRSRRGSFGHSWRPDCRALLKIAFRTTVNDVIRTPSAP